MNTLGLETEVQHLRHAVEEQTEVLKELVGVIKDGKGD